MHAQMSSVNEDYDDGAIIALVGLGGEAVAKHCSKIPAKLKHS